MDVIFQNFDKKSRLELKDNKIDSVCSLDWNCEEDDCRGNHCDCQYNCASDY